MNPIQKAWLKVLSPLSGFVNEKMAKRSGNMSNVTLNKLKFST